MLRRTIHGTVQQAVGAQSCQLHVKGGQVVQNSFFPLQKIVRSVLPLL